MEQILTYIATYSLPVFVIATCTILLIGILKLCKVFNKIENKNVKKFVYYMLDVFLSFGISALYFVIFKLNFENYIWFSVAQVSATTTLYAIYENFGVRKLVQMLLACIANWFKKNPESKLVKALKGLGLTEEAVTKLQALANTELENAKMQTTTVTTNTTNIN